MTTRSPSPPRVSPPIGGVDGNERLTSLVAAVLLILLFLVGLTVPVANAQTRLHVFLGVVVIPPVLLKVASTSWRFIKYYAGNFSYRRKGPPVLLLRLLGPVLVVVTLIMLFSGVGLVIGAPRFTAPTSLTDPPCVVPLVVRHYRGARRGTPQRNGERRAS